MSEIKTLYDAGVVADTAFNALNLAISALIVTTESMDDDGIQPRGKESPSDALNFIARFPNVLKFAPLDYSVHGRCTRFSQGWDRRYLCGVPKGGEIMSENVTIPRMRTAAKIVAEIKALDPDTEVTEHWVRQLTKEGLVPVVWAGRKALVNLNDVLALLHMGMEQKTPEPQAVGGIRRVEV